MSIERVKELGKKIDELVRTDTFKDDYKNVLLTWEYLTQGILACEELHKEMYNYIMTGQYIIMKRDEDTEILDYDEENDYHYWIRYGKKDGKPIAEYGEGKIIAPTFIVAMDWKDTVAVQTRKLRASVLTIHGRIWVKGNRMAANQWGWISWNVALAVARKIGKNFNGRKGGWWEGLNQQEEFKEKFNELESAMKDADGKYSELYE